jgi:hypothetical protein
MAARDLVDSLPIVYLCAKKRGSSRFLSLSAFRGVVALGGDVNAYWPIWRTRDLPGGQLTWPAVAVGAPQAREAFSPKTRWVPLVNHIHCFGPWGNTMLAMWRCTQLEVAPRCLIASHHPICVLAFRGSSAVSL